MKNVSFSTSSVALSEVTVCVSVDFISMSGRAPPLSLLPPPQAVRESIINMANTSVIDFFMVEFLSLFT